MDLGTLMKPFLLCKIMYEHEATICFIDRLPSTGLEDNKRKKFARKIFPSKCVLFVAEDGQPWAGDVAWEMRTLLPPVQTSSSVFSWIFTVQYSEFSIAHLITFAISTSLAAAAS